MIGNSQIGWGQEEYQLRFIEKQLERLIGVVSKITSGGGSGTVTSFSSGNLSPLFTTSVATSTTTPALSFTLSNAGADTWFGNNTVGSAVPSFNSAGILSKTDDTNVTLTLGGSPTLALLNNTSLTLGWTGTLTYARFTDGTGLSVVGRAINSAGVQADIVAGADFNILRRSGTSIGFGSINLSQSGAVGVSILPVANGGTGVSTGAWLLASGGTLSGVNTITSNTAVQQIFNGTWTASANTQNHVDWTGTITARGTASDTLRYFVIDPTLVSAAATQTLTAILINPTFTDVNSATKYIFRLQNAGSDRFTTQFDGTTTVTAGNSSTQSTLKVIGIGTTTNKAFQVTRSDGTTEAVSITDAGTLTITNASSATMLTIAGTATTTINGAGQISMTSMITPASTIGFLMIAGSAAGGTFQMKSQNVYNGAGATNILLNFISGAGFAYNTGTCTGTILGFNHTINNSGGTSTIRGIDYNPVETSLTGTTHYFITSRSLTALSGFAIATPANAYVVIGAGTATIAPFKLTSGTNLTTAVAGCMEYNGTDLFFTRTGTTRENVLVAIDNASAPATTATPTFTSYYGGNTKALGDPNRWISVDILGTVYKIPMYT